MKLRLLKLREVLADSFWFLPLLMALAAVGAALGSVALDHVVGSAWVEDIGWVWSGGADGARAVLSVVAGSIMTVVSIVFSLTVTTLAQTSSHFGPRVLRNFTSDRGVQVTLGTFIATFTYCLLVLRTVRSVDPTTFVPYLSVNVGVLLALVSLGVLIYFIHHVAQSIQAENLIARVGAALDESLQVLFPDELGRSAAEESVAVGPSADDWRWGQAATVTARRSGYLQRVDDERLMRVATARDLVFKLRKRPGDFVAASVTLLQVLPSTTTIDDALADELRACFGLGRHRTPRQDALCLVEQLVEIAARALSPGVNEPYTAITCLDWLGAWLRALLGRELPEPARLDDRHHVRVIAPSLDLETAVHAVFDPFRHHGAGSPEIVLHVLATVAELAPAVRREPQRRVLSEQVRLIVADSATIVNPWDRQRIDAAQERALQALAATSA